LAEAHKLYVCHDLLLRHKADLFSHLMARWRDLFNANFDVLLYDLTSTYPRAKPYRSHTSAERIASSQPARICSTMIMPRCMVFGPGGR
jgi:hypothetical protein